MLCENPKTNVAAKNSWKSRGKFKSLFLVRIIMGLTLFCHSDSSHTRLCRN
jgi:hypothetical protein